MASIVLILIYAAQVVLTGFLTDLCLRWWYWTGGVAAGARRYWMTVFTLLALLPVFGAFLPDSRVKSALQGAGNIWLGFFIYYGGILLMLMILMGIRHLVLHAGGGLWPGAVLCTSLALALAVTVCGLVHAQQTKVKRFDIAVGKPAGETREMKLVLIADLHLSVNSKLSTTQRMVELINREEPDAVLVAGDIFTSSYAALANPEAYAQALSGIRSKYGVFAVYGNHDVEETLFGGFPISPVIRAFRTAQMDAFLQRCGFRMLADETVRLGESVQLAGRIDGDKAGDGTANRMSAAELLKDADRSLPVLVLEHEPREFEALAQAGADAVLCGHTHNGQLFPGNLIIPLFNENAYGLKTIAGIPTIVTAGVGYYGPPMRVGTDSEITVVNLHFQ